jgi:hypothetical protein
MGRALGSWITAEALEKFDGEVLCDTLRTEVEIFREKGIDIPSTPDEANINYKALETFFHTGGEAEPLADALFFASKLNSEEGWNCVKEEMLTAGLQYTETGTLKISHGDHALKAWLRFKSKNPSLLERSLGRLQNISVFSFTLFPVNETIPDHDLVTTFDESSLAEVQNRIADYYYLQTGERFAKVIQHGGFDDEIYFMIRYPGRLEFRNVLDGDKEIKDKKNPIWFHTVVYDKRNRMLKTSATTQELAELLRIQFGHLLFRQPNVFQSNKDALSKVITLDPITEDTEAFFDTAKDTPIRKVRLSRISCTLKDMGRIKGTFTCDERDCRETVADFSPEGFTYSQNALTRKALTPAQKLLNSVHQIHWIQLKYEMKAPGDLRRGRDCKVTIKKGNQLGFEHDAGTRPILDYLYEKKIIKRYTPPAPR